MMLATQGERLTEAHPGARATCPSCSALVLWLFDMRSEERWERVHFGTKGFWWKHGSRTQTALRRPLFWQAPDRSVLCVQLNTVASERGTRVLGRVLRSYTTEEFIHGVTSTRAA